MTFTVHDGSLEDWETIEITVAVSWQYPRYLCDVDDDGYVLPGDVLLLINDINANQPRDLSLAALAAPGLPPFLDPSGEGWITPVDVLVVINFLNTYGSGPVPLAADGEGEDHGSIQYHQRESTSTTFVTDRTAGFLFDTAYVVQSRWPPLATQPIRSARSRSVSRPLPKQVVQDAFADYRWDETPLEEATRQPFPFASQVCLANPCRHLADTYADSDHRSPP